MIPLLDVIRHIDSAQPFSISVITCDQKKDEGGEILSIEKAVKCVGKKQGKLITAQPVGEKKQIRNPNHFGNRTRNIYDFATQRIIKIHIDLVTRFNGQPVI